MSKLLASALHSKFTYHFHLEIVLVLSGKTKRDAAYRASLFVFWTQGSIILKGIQKRCCRCSCAFCQRCFAAPLQVRQIERQL